MLNLSAREVEILDMLADGWSVQRIAEYFGWHPSGGSVRTALLRAQERNTIGTREALMAAYGRERGRRQRELEAAE